MVITSISIQRLDRMKLVFLLIFNVSQALPSIICIALLRWTMVIETEKKVASRDPKTL